MVIRSKYSLNKIYYEINGQESMFGRDNLSFKTVNMSKKQRLDNICKIFNLKKIIKKDSKVYLIIFLK